MRLVGSLLVAVVLSGCSERSPRSYDECITRNIKPGLDETSALLITESCRKQFPEKDLSRPLSYDELTKVTGRGDLASSGTSFVATLYNGNSEVTVTEIVIRLEYKRGKEQQFRDFKITSNIGALQAVNVFETVVYEPNFAGWTLVSGRGY